MKFTAFSSGILFCFFSIFWTHANVYMIDDSLSVDHIMLPDSIVMTLDQFSEEAENEDILGNLDDLVKFNFFTNKSFVHDTSELNIYNFPSDYIPVYPDSVTEQRMHALSKDMLIELTFNRHVSNYIDVYAVKKREMVSRVLGLAEIYFPLFEEHLDKHKMPLELKYLAVVESALMPTATSRAGAQGLWQFMYGTGRMYGLRVNSIIDYRNDPYQSTDAACRHLKDLYNIYGDWLLVLAAYNSGAGNVNKAIRRAGGIKNYWVIWPFLPRETRGYVPAFMAVAYLMNHTAEHNLYPVHPGFLYEEIDTVMVTDLLSFDQVSEMLNIPMDELKFLNPAYKVGIIPASADKKYPLRLPVHHIAGFIDNEQALYAYKTQKGVDNAKLQEEIRKATERSIHVVRSGENLGLIAQKYRVSVNNIKSWNNLRSNTIYPGQRLVVYPPGSSPATKLSAATTAGSNANNTGHHIVKSGENLGLIASKYKCTVADLKKWNNLKSDNIHPNQKLLVSKPGSRDTASNMETSQTTPEGYIYHIVRKGDTLWDIARLYKGVTVEQIKRLNNIQNSNRLKPGQKLKVASKG
jgi:membrane-bound lytic murein transglycosylase D